MSKDIKITAGDVVVEAQLNNSKTAKSIGKALPIKARAQRWGEEIYFSIGVKAELEKNSRDVVEAGELGYWPDGSAFCMFFGLTPASVGNEIRAASAVNIIGEMKSDWSGLTNVPVGASVLIEPA
jgi:hypothetical protein